MRNLKFQITFLLVGIFLYHCSKHEISDQYIYLTSYIESNIIVDGVLDDNDWKNIEKISLKFNKTGDVVSDNSIMTSVKACYNEQYLFIAFECNDADIWSEYTKRDEHLWKNEVVEVFIDTDDSPNTYYEIEVSPKNVLFDAYVVQPDQIDVDDIIKFDMHGIKTAVSVDGTLNNRNDIDKKWTVEIAIPFAGMNKESAMIESDLKAWRVNFYRINQVKEEESVGFAWSPTAKNFHVPSKFGILKFDK
ncbi:carbohydrate-binding family 9-like protein [Candidatus Neomarinimicrobiota bacterium]